MSTQGRFTGVQDELIEQLNQLDVGLNAALSQLQFLSGVVSTEAANLRAQLNTQIRELTGQIASIRASIEQAKQQERLNCFRKPKLAAIDYRNDAASYGVEAVKLHAKFEWSLRNMSATTAASVGAKFAQMLKSVSPSTKLGAYTILSQLYTSNSDFTEAVANLDANGWWVYAAGTNNKTRSDTAYPAYEVNQTNKAAVDYIANFWSKKVLKPLVDVGGLDFVFNDNVWTQPHPDNQIPLKPMVGVYTGTSNQQPSAVAVDFRNGYTTYWDALRSKLCHPSLKVVGNVEYSTSTFTVASQTPELQKQLNAVLMEAVVGRSYSLDTYNYFSNVMTWYRNAIDSAKETAFVLAYVDSNNKVDCLRKLRYGLGLTMLDDGHFMPANEPGKLSGASVAMRPYWISEFDQHIGMPLEPRKTSATANGLWTREYENGLVVVNPTDNNGRWLAQIAGTTLSRINGKVRLVFPLWLGGKHGRVVGDKVWIDAVDADTTLNGFFSITATGDNWVEWECAGNDISLSRPKGFFRFQTSLDLTGKGFTRFLGSDDAHDNYDNGTSQNDGTAVSVLKLWAGDAILLLRV